MVKEDRKQTFKFKQFSINQDQCTMKVGTDGVLLAAWAEVEDCQSVLDIGTGSGVIAIMMAQRVPQAKIQAVEIEDAAFHQAKENMALSPWSERLEVVHSSIQDFARFHRSKFDLIISNPPFFSGGTFSNNQDRNNVRHTIKLPNGDLLSAARNLLHKTGRFCVILPHLEGLRFVEVARNYNLYCTKMTEVYPKEDKPVERLLLQFELVEREMETNSLVIQKEARNDYTEDYIALTKDFYLKM